MLGRKGIVRQLLPALVVPLFLIIMVAIFTQFRSNIDQTGWSSEANETLTKVESGTWGGYKLASMLPYIIIAMVVLGILLGAFVFKGI